LRPGVRRAFISFSILAYGGAAVKPNDGIALCAALWYDVSVGGRSGGQRLRPVCLHNIACKEADAFEKIAVCRAVRGVVPFHVRVQR